MVRWRKTDPYNRVGMTFCHCRLADPICEVFVMWDQKACARWQGHKINSGFLLGGKTGTAILPVSKHIGQSPEDFRTPGLKGINISWQAGCVSFSGFRCNGWGRCICLHWLEARSKGQNLHQNGEMVQNKNKTVILLPNQRYRTLQWPPHNSSPHRYWVYVEWLWTKGTVILQKCKQLYIPTTYKRQCWDEHARETSCKGCKSKRSKCTAV